MKTFEQLFEELKEKVQQQDKNSNTVKLLNSGIHSIGKKVVEEAAEVWMASEFQSKEQVAEEISQLLYHLQLVMLAKELELDDIYRYL